MRSFEQNVLTTEDLLFFSPISPSSAGTNSLLKEPAGAKVMFIPHSWAANRLPELPHQREPGSLAPFARRAGLGSCQIEVPA